MLRSLLLVLCMSVMGSVAGEQTSDQALAQRVLADTRMDEVDRMGRALLATGMSAGGHYEEVWIRDLNTFIVPLLEETSKDQVREALLTFFHFQGEDGNIVDGYVSKARGETRYAYRYTDTKPDLKAHKNTVETDQETSLIQALSRYIRATGDAAILDEEIRGVPVRGRVDAALDYLFKYRWSEEHGLIWGATTADWGDVQPEHEWGVELNEDSHRAIDIYDNALLSAALQDYFEINAAAQIKWGERQSQLRAAIRDQLWDAKAHKFIPHIYLDGSPFPTSFDESAVYYFGGTAVAMEAGLLSREDIAATYALMRATLETSGATTIGLTVYPPYPAGSFLNPSMAPFSYQNGGDWTWFGARGVRQLAANGFVAEAYRELEPMLDRVMKHDGFFEWWTKDNEPKGSGSFRGSAGVLIEAIGELRAWAEQQQVEVGSTK